jgi:Fe(II)/alpha-ketoglutarate-dependent arginine beta-hydroxylase
MPSIDRIELDDRQVAGVARVVGEVEREFDSVESLDFLDAAGTRAQELPRPLRERMNRFRLREEHAACLVAGYPVDDAVIEPTPGHWISAKHLPSVRHHEFFLALLAALLGDPFAWATQQDGYLMHDVLPIEEHRYEQLGSGSLELLTWHTEDAFHPLRPDYLGLLCLRNPDGVETTLASIDDLSLDPALSGLLRQPRFPIRPDRSHLPEHAVAPADGDTRVRQLIARSYEWIQRLDAAPEKVPVFFGAEDSPYVRLDPYFMQDSTDDPDAAAALAAIGERIEAVMGGCVLRPGDVLFLDNYKAVHGRKPFEARFDGTDRWLKRVNITRDLRKSRGARPDARSRTIY